MIGFALDENGDVLMKNNVIQTVEGTDLLLQKIKTVLSENKGEWFLNDDEGINFNNILGKNNPEELVRSEIEQGLQQVDSTFSILDFECIVDKKTRLLTVNFTAKNEDNVTVSQQFDF